MSVARKNIISKRLFSKIAFGLLYAVLLLFLIRYLLKLDYTQLKGMSIDPIYISLAVFLGLISRYWAGYIWYSILKSLGAGNIENKSLLYYIYAKSWMARYIPGTVTWVVSKVYFASKHGISKRKLAVSSILEGALQVAVVLIFSTLVLMLDGRLSIISNQQRLLLIAGACVAAVCLHPAIFNKAVAILYKIFKKKNLPRDDFISPAAVLKSSLKYILWSVLAGIGAFFVCKSLYSQLNFSDTIFIVGASSLAGAMGMLAFFAPSGLGVKEGVLILLLSVVMPPSYAVVASIVIRLWDFVVDIVFLMTSKMASSSRRTDNLPT